MDRVRQGGRERPHRLEGKESTSLQDINEAGILIGGSGLVDCLFRPSAVNANNSAGTWSRYTQRCRYVKKIYMHVQVLRHILYVCLKFSSGVVVIQ